jgi:hypothetical protein
MIGERIEVWLVILAVAAVLSCATILALLAFARVLRLGVTEAELGFGPVLFSKRVFSVKTRVRLIPSSSWIAPYPSPHPPDGDQEYDRVARRVTTGELRGYDALSPLARVAFVAVLFAVPAIAACSALGPAAAFAHAARDVRTLFSGAVASFSTARTALDRALGVLHSDGLAALARRLTAVLFAAQIFTLGNIQFLTRTRPRWATNVAMVWSLVAFVLCLMWLLALVAWTFR